MMPEMNAESVGHGHSHGGGGMFGGMMSGLMGGSHGHSHGQGGHSHGQGGPAQNPEMMQMMQNRMKMVQEKLQEQGITMNDLMQGGSQVDMEKLMQVRQALIQDRISQAQQMMSSQGASSPVVSNMDALGGASSADGHTMQHFSQEQSNQFQMPSGAKAPYPHMQEGWSYKDPNSSDGPIDPSLITGGGHYTPPSFGWGELANKKVAPSDEVHVPISHSQIKTKSNAGGFKGFSDMWKNMPMPHEETKGFGIMQCTVPYFGRLRILRDFQGLFMFSVVILYWFYGNFTVWNCILLPRYYDGQVHGFLLCWYAILSVLCISSLFKASFMNPGGLHHRIDQNSTEHVDWEYCTQCESKRPPRAHHCRRCKQCVRKMDHHCPWINNCVGEDNQFAFVLLIFYAFTLSLSALTIAVMDRWYMAPCASCVDALESSFALTHKHGLVTGLMVLGGLMIVFSCGLICQQHMGIVLDTTTLEWMQLQRIYYSTGKVPDQKELPNMHRGCYYNYKETCGHVLWCVWPFPCRRGPPTGRYTELV